jgi:putative transposase
MSIRPTPFVTGEYYHLYNRGNSKQVIFNDEQDHLYFINLLMIVNSKQRVKSGVNKSVDPEEKVISIGAYCLMPNHFHILVKQEKDGGITVFMQKLLTGYSMYYNKKYARTGSLFEGKFKSKYAGIDTYLKYLFSYIHLNPLKIIDKNWKIEVLHAKRFDFEFLLKYPYSSFSEYYTRGYELVNREAFPDYFPNKASFLKEISSWLKLSEY